MISSSSLKISKAAIGESRENMNGLIQIYTGDGKGKTSAAFGLIMRAVGRGLRCVVIQFLKGTTSGEVTIARNLGICNIFQFGTKDFLTPEYPQERIIKRTREGLEFAKKVLSSGDFELVVLDEILTAYALGIIGEEDLISIVDAKAKRTELVMTGLKAPESIIERAQLITEMKKIKHYFDKGIKARKGFEF